MRLLKTLIRAVVLALIGSAALATGPTFPERDRRAVVDAAQVIPDAAESKLNAEIVAWNRATGHQLVVATVPSLQDYEIEEYGYRLLRHWGLGRAGINDGVILLLAPGERKVRIEVGYGLEPVLTDALSSAIIRDTISPGLRSGDIEGALGGGARRIMQAATEEAAYATPAAVAGPPMVNPPFPWGFFLFMAGLILGPIFLFWLARRKRNTPAEPRLSTAERRYATVPRAEHRKSTSSPDHFPQSDARTALSAHASGPESSSSSWSSGSDSWDSSSSSSSSSSSDTGFDSGGGSAGGGGADSSY